jgi:hypothetical protein
MLLITVPEGVRAGELVLVDSPIKGSVDGATELLEVAVPPGLGPGDTFEVEVHSAPALCASSRARSAACRVPPRGSYRSFTPHPPPEEHSDNHCPPEEHSDNHCIPPEPA